MRQLFWRAATRRNDVDVEIAVAIARERNPFSVRRETRIGIARFVDCQPLDVLSIFISDPNVAEISERNAAVRVAGIANQLRFTSKNDGRERENKQTNK